MGVEQSISETFAAMCCEEPNPIQTKPTKPTKSKPKFIKVTQQSIDEYTKTMLQQKTTETRTFLKSKAKYPTPIFPPPYHSHQDINKKCKISISYDLQYDILAIDEYFGDLQDSYDQLNHYKLPIPTNTKITVKDEMKWRGVGNFRT